MVLAAGRSSRMGAFKPLLEVDGRTLLERAVGVFTGAGVGDVVVVAGHRRDEVAAVAARAGARVITNPGYDQGMFSSLRMGTVGLDPGVTRFFVLPADVALVRPETIGRLLRQSRAAHGGTAEVVYPLRAGVEGHPPLLGGALRAEIRAADPPGGLRELLLGHAAASAVVEVDDPGVLLDADTPEDLARMRGLAAGEGLPDAARCLRLLAERGVPRERIDHSLVETAVATAHTTALNERRQHLIAPLVTAGALLHDVAREQPRHAEAGAALLERLGYPRVAAVVRPHVRLGPRAGDEPDEAQVVYLADKLVQGSSVAGLDARFAVRLDRVGGPEARAAVLERKEEAVRVLRRVEQVLGAPVDEVLPAGA
ncbi:MAG: DVU_1551 family NTP transferase [Deltaproteobacteria bacterium]